jgi:hypothetical protein
MLEEHKDGSYGMANLACALYSNGYNPRGQSKNNPCGLIFEDEEAVFSIGYFQKEQTLGSEGYIFFVSPRGKNVLRKVTDLTREVLAGTEIPCQGVYVRFLELNQYLELLKKGFLPIKEAPWHPEAPEEDESYSHSIVSLENLVSQENINLVDAQSRNSRRKARDSYNRFRNFLDRNNLTYRLEESSITQTLDAREIVEKHFEMLRGKGKDISSTPEDYHSLFDVDILGIEGVQSYVGWLGGEAVSVFIGEKLSDTRFGLYTAFTLREKELINLEFKDRTGFSAISMYAYIELFKKLSEKGVEEVHLGGSELPDLNIFKRRLGAKIGDPTYWAVMLK